MGKRNLVVLLLLFLLATAPQPIQAQSDPSSEIVSLINDFRGTLGLPPFTYNSQLAVAAQTQSTFMSENNIYSHTGYGGSRPYDRAVAAGYSGRVSENIVGGGDMSPRQGLIWWQNSPVHYDTITSPVYTEIGGGFAQGFSQNFYAIVVGLPAAAVAAAPEIEAAVSAEPSAPIAVKSIILSQPDTDGSIRHTLAAGQALWTLAAYYDVPIDYLLRINNLTADDFVQPGEEVLIQLAEGQPSPTPPPTPTPPYTHIVQEGQNLWSIAAFYDIDLPTLLYYNSITDNDPVWPGLELIVRLREGQAPPATATPQMTHIVNEGDTLWTIAVWHGLSVEELLAFNNLQENAFIQPGSELYVRAAFAEQDSAEPPAATPSPIQLGGFITSTPSTVATPPAPNPSRQAVVVPAQQPTTTAVAQVVTLAPTAQVAAELVSVADDSADTFVQNMMILAAILMLVAAFFVRQLGRASEA